MRCVFQISDEVGAIMVTVMASPVASGVAIMTAQNGQPRRDCCCLNLIGHYYVYIYIQEIIIVYNTHTSSLPMRACSSGPEPGRISVRGHQHRTGPGPGSGTQGHAHMDMKNLMMIKLHWLHFRRLFFLVVVSARAANWPKQISPHEVRPQKAESYQGAGFGVTGGIAGCQLQPPVPSVAAGWPLAALCSSVPKSSTENTLHVKIYDNLLHSFKWCKLYYLPMTAEGDGRRSGGLCCRRWRP